MKLSSTFDGWSKIPPNKRPSNQPTRIMSAIRPFNEEFGEFDHVNGNRKFRKFGSMRSAAWRGRAYQGIIRWKVTAIKESFIAGKKRKRVTTEKNYVLKTIANKIFLKNKNTFPLQKFLKFNIR